MTTENSRIYFYQGQTLIDITNTGVTKYSPDVEKQRNQQRNWETVVQLLGLRSQIISLEQFAPNVVDIGSYNFGSKYSKRHKVWQFRFGVEFKDLYQLDNDPVGILVTDFMQIPVVMGLDETIELDQGLFYTSGENKNIHFKTLV
jgi:hypothetical protein